MTEPFQWPAGVRAAVSLTFDDARWSQSERCIPLLDAQSVAGTFYVVPSAVEQRLDDWLRAVAAGHEIGCHTLTHPCSGNFAFARDNALEDYTLDRIAADIDAANDRIEALLAVRPRTFAYPCGQRFVGRGTGVRSYVPVVAERFIAGRGFRDEAPNDPGFLDMAQALAVDFDELKIDDLLAWVGKAVESAGWLIFAGHEVGDGGRQTVLEGALNELCAYCRDPAHGIWIDTVAAVADYISSTR